MIKVFNGTVTDEATSKPIQGAHVWQLATRTGGVITDDTGAYSIMIDDGQPEYFKPWAIDADGYGGAVVDSATTLDGFDCSLYSEDADPITKIKAVVKNHFWGYALTVAVIVIILLIAKKYL